MSDPALSPTQLDRLEDALEDLELSGIPEALLDPADDDARPVADALEVYRSILVMSRQALTVEEVPAGLLDDVLVEARRAAAAPAEPEAGRASQRRPWWRRLGGLGPALAFAGTAALLVVLVRPASEDAQSPAIARREPTDKAAADGSRAPAAASPTSEVQPPSDEEANAGDAMEKAEDMRLAEAQSRAEAEEDAFDELGGEGQELRGGAVDTARRDRKVAPATDPAPSLDDDVAGRAKTPASKSTSSGRASKGGRGYDPEPAPTAEPKPTPQKAGPTTGSGAAPGGSAPRQPAAPPANQSEESKAKKEDAADGWADIATGDAQRRAGACGSAKVAYQRAREDDDAAVRARALAGLGLCELAAGNTSTAEGLFAKARATDPRVGKLIESERARHEPQDQAQAADEAPAP